MAITFWSVVIPLGAAAFAYAVKPTATSAILGGVVGFAGYYLLTRTNLGIFQNSVSYGIPPAAPVQLVPSQNRQAYAPLIVTGRQNTGSYIF